MGEHKRGNATKQSAPKAMSGNLFTEQSGRLGISDMLNKMLNDRAGFICKCLAGFHGFGCGGGVGPGGCDRFRGGTSRTSLRGRARCRWRGGILKMTTVQNRRISWSFDRRHRSVMLGEPFGYGIFEDSFAAGSWSLPLKLHMAYKQFIANLQRDFPPDSFPVEKSAVLTLQITKNPTALDVRQFAMLARHIGRSDAKE